MAYITQGGIDKLTQDYRDPFEEEMRRLRDEFELRTAAARAAGRDTTDMRRQFEATLLTRQAQYQRGLTQQETGIRGRFGAMQTSTPTFTENNLNNYPASMYRSFQGRAGRGLYPPTSGPMTGDPGMTPAPGLYPPGTQIGTTGGAVPQQAGTWDRLAGESRAPAGGLYPPGTQIGTTGGAVPQQAGTWDRLAAESRASAGGLYPVGTTGGAVPQAQPAAQPAQSFDLVGAPETAASVATRNAAGRTATNDALGATFGGLYAPGAFGLAPAAIPGADPYDRTVSVPTMAASPPPAAPGLYPPTAGNFALTAALGRGPRPAPMAGGGWYDEALRAPAPAPAAGYIRPPPALRPRPLCRQACIRQALVFWSRPPRRTIRPRLMRPASRI
jgi:hypothetical protein